jgi:phosphate transport system protein
MRTQFHEDLERMELTLLSLGELAGNAVQKSVACVVSQDEALAREVIAEDDAVDELYLTIDGGILQLLALQSPVAQDLRLVSAILHSCLHLERIGDQAVNIAKIHLAVAGKPGSDVMRQQIAEMGDIVVRMIRTAMEAFAKRDVDLCRQLPTMDDPVDRLNRLTHLEALKLADDPRALDWGMHMNMAARALERVGDNAVDIAEQVGFLVTGDFHEYTDASHPVENEV